MDELYREEKLLARLDEKSKHRRQRYNTKRKVARFMKVVRGVHKPHVGWVDHKLIDGKMMPVGLHIKRPKNSNFRQYYKTISNRAVRRDRTIAGKGNHYRKCYDLWWALY